MKKLISVSFVALALAFSCAIAAAVAQEEEKSQAEQVMDRLFESVDEIEPYSVIFEYMEPANEDSRKVWRKCEFWYMGSGDYIRLEVHDGENKGSKVAYNTDKNKEKVYAKQGFMPIAIPLSVDDKRLEGFFVSDWGSDLEDISKLADGAELEYLGEEEIEGRAAHKIEILNSSEEAEFDRAIVWVDKENDLLLQYEYYNGDTLDSRKTWYGYKLNRDFKAKDFKP